MPHGFRGSSPWLAGSIALGPVVRQNFMVGLCDSGTTHHMAARRQTEGKGAAVPRPQEAKPLLTSLPLHGPHLLKAQDPSRAAGGDSVFNTQAFWEFPQGRADTDRTWKDRKMLHPKDPVKGHK